MSAILFVALALSAPPESSATPAPPAAQPQLCGGVLSVSPGSSATPATVTTTSSTAVQPAASKSLAQWRDDVSSALRQQATAKDLEQKPAVARLMALYDQLAQPQQLPSGEQSRLRAKLRNRLLRLRTEIPVDLQVRQMRVDSIKLQAKEEKKPELLEKVVTDQAVLAQWNGVLGQAAGAVQPGAGSGGGLDDGQRLADLIQDVISPESWSVNGGPGAVVYYPHLHSLIVTATTEVQEQTSQLLDALRRVGN